MMEPKAWAVFTTMQGAALRGQFLFALPYMPGKANDERYSMAKEHSSVFQARADDADAEMKAASLESVKGRFESARDAWQGLADGARDREGEETRIAEAKASRSEDK